MDPTGYRRRKTPGGREVWARAHKARSAGTWKGCDRHHWQPKELFRGKVVPGKTLLHCPACGATRWVSEQTTFPHWVILKRGLKEPLAFGWKQHAATRRQADSAGPDLGIIPGHSAIAVIDHDGGPLKPVLEHLKSVKVTPLAVIPSETKGRHHVLVPVAAGCVVTAVQWKLGRACGQLLCDHLVKVYDRAKWDQAIVRRKTRKVLLDPSSLPGPPPSPPTPPCLGSLPVSDPPPDGAAEDHSANWQIDPVVGHDGGTVPWVTMGRTPLERVEEGIRNQWLVAAGVRRRAADPKVDVLAYLRALNEALPCEALPDEEVVAMQPGVRRWGAWLRKALALRAVSTDHTPRMQAERGRRSGQARRRKAEERRQEVARLRGQGWTQAAIAKELGVSERTVRAALVPADDRQGATAPGENGV